MATHDLTRIIEKASSGEALSEEEAQGAFDRIMRGEASPVQMAALLVALRTKGASPSEVAGGVKALRKAMIPVLSSSGEDVIDTCGTGGGSVTTFNISTTAALVAAGAGVRIAKHGNRSFTSKSGSADVLEALGVRIELEPAQMARILEETGIVFMFAPLLHPAMRHVAPVRRELGVRTIMNILGPLTNPAGARRQVVGVADPELLPLIAEALAELGHTRAMVVHGAPGMDEVSPSGPTEVAELAEGSIRRYRLDPQALGLELQPVTALAGGLPDENAALIRKILEGEEPGAPRSATLLNAAAAIYVAGKAESVQEGVERAAASIDEGAARDVLDRLREASHRV